MIYLIQTTYYDETENISIKLLKLGYTKDENKDTRYSQYSGCIIHYFRFFLKYLEA